MFQSSDSVAMETKSKFRCVLVAVIKFSRSTSFIEVPGLQMFYMSDD